jgi:hypothetical protein
MDQGEGNHVGNNNGYDDGEDDIDPRTLQQAVARLAHYTSSQYTGEPGS